MNKTLTRAEIADSISDKLGLSKPQATEILESFLDTISQELVAHGEVKISSFGTFYARQKRQRIGRNPKTGVEVPITPRRSLSFRASSVLKEHVNK